MHKLSTAEMITVVLLFWFSSRTFIISGEGGSHLPPKEVPESTYGRLLKGYIGISEDYSYKS